MSNLQKGIAKLSVPSDLQKKLLKQTADRKKSTQQPRFKLTDAHLEFAA